MNLSTGTPISQLPTGTVIYGNDFFLMVHGITGSVVPETQRVEMKLFLNYIGKYNLQFFLGNGATVVPTGTVSAGYPYLVVPADTLIDSWQVYADATGTFTANVLKSTAAGFPPSSPLAGLGQPKLTNQRNNSGNATGTVSLLQGDVLQVQVTSASTVKLLTVSLQGKKV